MNKEELFKEIEELEKALEAKKAEIEKLEKQDRLKNYEDVKAGETFLYKDHEYTKLRNGRAIINDYDSNFMDCLFDNVNNDYNKSLVRYYINSERFLQFLGLCHLDFSFSGGDIVMLLSEEEYEKNKDIIKRFNNWWWLRSGRYYSNDSAYYACSNGCVDSSLVYSGLGVRPSFDFQDGIEVEVINE